MQKPYIVIVGVSLFFITLFLINTIHQYDEIPQQIQEAQYIKATDLLAVQVPFPWEIKQPDEEHLKILDQNETDIIEEKKFTNGITREELGRAGWTLLHMISATLPVDFDEEFTFKINVFLNLFGQFFPCKECAGHFLNMTTVLPYEGTTRVDFMQYLCMLHNEVNERLQKPTFNCSEIHQRWGGDCGCKSALEESIKKYSKGQN
ncbi:unnamed protein product [Paramecium pentaurelia]|uniref:ERV/ALR sulfhydryl oxidase domain-containing protein n=1 Tax=Paramecium pentaurelia TaxID=43138 RepID=A0A8S1UX21_9CILI|nr:unnamed protein product [Paramecium pentaurelia]